MKKVVVKLNVYGNKAIQWDNQVKLTPCTIIVREEDLERFLNYCKTFHKIPERLIEIIKPEKHTTKRKSYPKVEGKYKKVKKESLLTELAKKDENKKDESKDKKDSKKDEKGFDKKKKK